MFPYHYFEEVALSEKVPTLKFLGFIEIRWVDNLALAALYDVDTLLVVNFQGIRCLGSEPY